jgi:hypothetical protein
MEVQVFAASRRAVLEKAGGVTAEGFPITSCYVDTLPTQITILLVLAVHTSGGTDYDMHRFIIATSPEGERVGLLEFGWGWPDEPGQPVKFRVFADNWWWGSTPPESTTSTFMTTRTGNRKPRSRCR